MYGFNITMDSRCLEMHGSCSAGKLFQKELLRVVAFKLLANKDPHGSYKNICIYHYVLPQAVLANNADGEGGDSGIV